MRTMILPLVLAAVMMGGAAFAQERTRNLVKYDNVAVARVPHAMQHGALLRRCGTPVCVKD